jgi:methylmalonyl-CoA/ethylmalonyl-CoA epimerase
VLKRIDHLGLAVPSLDEALPFYRDRLGLVLEGVEVVPGYGVKVAFLRIGESRLELLEPTSGEGMIADFLRRHGAGIHHVAYAVEDIEEAIRACERRGCRMMDRAPRPGAHGARVAFLHADGGESVVTELCERGHARRAARPPAAATARAARARRS